MSLAFFSMNNQATVPTTVKIKTAAFLTSSTITMAVISSVSVMVSINPVPALSVAG